MYKVMKVQGRNLGFELMNQEPDHLFQYKLQLFVGIEGFSHELPVLLNKIPNSKGIEDLLNLNSKFASRFFFFDW